VSVELWRRLVPDKSWNLVAPLLPSVSRPQGGGTAPPDERDVFTAVVYVAMQPCAWQQLPSDFGVAPATAHRRFVAWTEAGVWPRLRRAAQDELGHHRAEFDWTMRIVDAVSMRPLWMR
jgi:transposase